MLPKDKLKSFILNLCDTAYGTTPAGCLNAFDARGLTKAEIDHRCGMAGYEPRVVFASLVELSSEGWLIGHPLGDGDVQFWRGQLWANERAIGSQSVLGVQGLAQNVSRL